MWGKAKSEDPIYKEAYVILKLYAGISTGPLLFVPSAWQQTNRACFGRFRRGLGQKWKKERNNVPVNHSRPVEGKMNKRRQPEGFIKRGLVPPQ